MRQVATFVHKHLNPSQYNEQENVGRGESTRLFPSAADLFRFRKQRGVNLGSWFVLERWIAEAPFQSAIGSAQSDLDVAHGSRAREILENHWDTWIQESDWAWIAERGLNAVRIPIGYYHISGADSTVLKGTEFAGLDLVYYGAWQRITKAILTANQFGLGVLIDLHAAPGKQNRDAHSGSTGEPRFFNKANMTHTIHVLTALITHLTSFCNSFNPPLPNLLGIELLNEPQQDPSLKGWYTDAIRAVRMIDPSIPIYIGDSWMTDHYAEFIAASQSVPFTVLDHHLYRCFTHEDNTTSITQHSKALTDPNAATPQMLSRVSQKLQGAGGALIIGEWLGAINPGSLRDIVNEDASRRDYIDAQLALYDRHCSGSFFWTYKKEQPGDKGWSLRDAVAAGVFPSSVGLQGARDKLFKNDSSMEFRRQEAHKKASEDHRNHWARYPGHYEHWRFDAGFLQGWDDAWLFFRSPWVKVRLCEHLAGERSNNVWEYEHGFQQGAQKARDDLRGQ